MNGGDPVLAEWLARARNAPLVEALPQGWKTQRSGHNLACACPRQPGSRDTLNLRPNKHVWLCRRCDKGSGSAIDLMIHTGMAADVFEAAERLTGERRPGRASDPAAREAARRGMESEQAGFAAGRAGEDMHQALAGSVYDAARFETGFASGLKARRLDEAERLQEEGRRERARAIYDHAAHCPREISAYFAARGIAFRPPAWMRFAPALDYWHERAIIHRGPALITPMFAALRQIAAVHVTWIDLACPPKYRPALTDKAGAALPTKKMFGPARGAAMWLTARKPLMLIGEGLETVAAVLTAKPQAGGVAAGSLGAFASLSSSVFMGVEEVILLGDADSERATAEHYLRQAAAAARAAGVKKVRLAFPPAGKDFADLAAREGV